MNCEWYTLRKATESYSTRISIIRFSDVSVCGGAKFHIFFNFPCSLYRHGTWIVRWPNAIRLRKKKRNRNISKPTCIVCNNGDKWGTINIINSNFNTICDHFNYVTICAWLTICPSFGEVSIAMQCNFILFFMSFLLIWGKIHFQHFPKFYENFRFKWNWELWNIIARYKFCDINTLYLRTSNFYENLHALNLKIFNWIQMKSCSLNECQMVSLPNKKKKKPQWWLPTALHSTVYDICFQWHLLHLL